MAAKGVFSDGHVTFKITVNVSFRPKIRKLTSDEKIWTYEFPKYNT